jgi:hypothetical protein
MSRNHQTTLVVWIFHWVISNIVLRTIVIMRLAHRVFEAFDHPDLDLTRFVEWKILPKCDQVLVSWSCGVVYDNNLVEGWSRDRGNDGNTVDARIFK